jgi:hypothetical protein
VIVSEEKRSCWANNDHSGVGAVVNTITTVNANATNQNEKRPSRPLVDGESGIRHAASFRPRLITFNANHC